MAKRIMKPAVTNENGLTKAQFLAACGPVPIMDLGKLGDAWSAGEDPSDYRKLYEDQAFAAARKAGRA